MRGSWIWWVAIWAPCGCLSPNPDWDELQDTGAGTGSASDSATDTAADTAADTDGTDSDGTDSGDSDSPEPLLPPARHVCGGLDHTCATGLDGSLQCWGGGHYGQLGNGSYASSPTPQTVDLDGVVDLACADNFTCATLEDQTVWCWGNNDSNVLGFSGIPDSNVPVRVPGVSGAVGVAVGGSDHACALIEDGTVWCWGSNGYGQTGSDDTAPHLYPGIEGAVRIAAGYYHTCVIHDDASVTCWGKNEWGNAGDPEFSSSVGPTVVDIDDVVKIDGGNSNTCALKADGTAWCWGADGSQLGPNSPEEDTATPVQVGAFEDIVDIQTNQGFTCALRASGTLHCWGADDRGQLGNTQPLAFGNATRVFLGKEHACALVDDSDLWCWGSNIKGQLGRDEMTCDPSPSTVLGLTTMVQMDSSDDGTCAVSSDGTAWCWGRNSGRKLGDTTWTTRPSPVRAVPTITSLINQVAVGNSHACALDDAGDVWCWGDGSYGQLGDGELESSELPVLAMSGASAISTNGYHTCAIGNDTAATLWCWGYNPYGQVGDGTDGEHRGSPVNTGLQDVVEVATARYHTCARTSAGELYCWGVNWSGQLGIGDDDDVNTSEPNALALTFTPIAIALGEESSCALDDTGSLWCWGHNEFDKFGTDAFSSSDIPERVADFGPTATALGTGEGTTCVVVDREVQCAGINDTGQLGAGSLDRKQGFVPSIGANALTVSGGERHTCALLSDGTVSCFGSFYDGTLGDDRIVEPPAPAPVVPG
jgi:alpha-tubulin suppressor-like RCC1 family protein